MYHICVQFRRSSNLKLSFKLNYDPIVVVALYALNNNTDIKSWKLHEIQQKLSLPTSAKGLITCALKHAQYSPPIKNAFLRYFGRKTGHNFRSFFALQ